MSHHTSGTVTTISEDGILSQLLLSCRGWIEDYDDERSYARTKTFNSEGDDESNGDDDGDYTVRDSRDDDGGATLETIEECQEDTGDDDDEEDEEGNDKDILRRLSGAVETDDTESDSDETDGDSTFDGESTSAGESCSGSTLSSMSFHFDSKHNSSHRRTDNEKKDRNTVNDNASIDSTVKDIELFLMMDQESERQTDDKVQTDSNGVQLSDVNNSTNDPAESDNASFSQIEQNSSKIIVASVDCSPENGSCVQRIYAIVDAPSWLSTAPSEQIVNERGLYDLDSGEKFVASFDCSYPEALNRNKLKVRRYRLNLRREKNNNNNNINNDSVDTVVINSAEKEVLLVEKLYQGWSEKLHSLNGKNMGALLGFGRRKPTIGVVEKPIPMPRLTIDHVKQESNPTRAIAQNSNVAGSGKSVLRETVDKKDSLPMVKMIQRQERQGPPVVIPPVVVPSGTINRSPIGVDATSRRYKAVSDRSLVPTTKPSSMKKTKNKTINQSYDTPTSSSISTFHDKYSTSTKTKKVRNTSTTGIRSHRPSGTSTTSGSSGSKNRKNSLSSNDTSTKFLSIRNPALLRDGHDNNMNGVLPLTVTKLFYHEALEPEDTLFSQFDFVPLESLNST